MDDIYNKLLNKLTKLTDITLFKQKQLELKSFLQLAKTARTHGCDIEISCSSQSGVLHLNICQNRMIPALPYCTEFLQQFAAFAPYLAYIDKYNVSCHVGCLLSNEAVSYELYIFHWSDELADLAKTIPETDEKIDWIGVDSNNRVTFYTQTTEKEQIFAFQKHLEKHLPKNFQNKLPAIEYTIQQHKPTGEKQWKMNKFGTQFDDIPAELFVELPLFKNLSFSEWAPKNGPVSYINIGFDSQTDDIHWYLPINTEFNELECVSI